jgi:hypothetical protein
MDEHALAPDGEDGRCVVDDGSWACNAPEFREFITGLRRDLAAAQAALDEAQGALRVWNTCYEEVANIDHRAMFVSIYQVSRPRYGYTDFLTACRWLSERLADAWPAAGAGEAGGR